MIGQLPTALKVGGETLEIRSDFRNILLILSAYGDENLAEWEKAEVCLRCLYRGTPSNPEAALSRAMWFIDGGDAPRTKAYNRKVLDWEQDESIMFPALNRAAGCELRLAPYVHWWTFLGYFGELQDGLFSQVISIRAKRAEGKKLEKYEREFYTRNKALIDIKIKLSEEEQAEIDRIKQLMGE